MLQIAFLYSLLTAPLLWAEPPAQFQLEDIVIMASRNDSAVKDIPAHVTVVPRERLEQVNPPTLDELLSRTVPNADTDGAVSGQSAFRQVILRGAGDQSRTLVLLDGVPIVNGRNGQTNWNVVPTKSVERIEVIPGPLGGLYGSGGMGGVINVVTRVPQAPRETTLEGLFGSLNTGAGRFYQGGRSGPLAYTLAGSIYNTDGYVADNPAKSFHVPRYRKEGDIHSKFIYQPSEDSSYAAGFIHARDHIGRGRNYFNFTFKNYIAYLTAAKSWLGLAWRGNAYWEYFSTFKEQDKSPGFNSLDQFERNNAYVAGASLNATHRWENGGKTTAGIESRASRMADSIEFVKSIRSQDLLGRQLFLAFFAQHEWRLMDGRLLPSLSGRVDWFRSYNGFFGDTNPAAPITTSHPAKESADFSPQFGLLYRWTERTTLRAAGGKRFQAPNVGLLYRRGSAGAGITLVGNPALGPENLWSYELGWDQKAAEGLKTQMTFYQTRGSNFFVQRNISATLAQNDNVGTVETLGVETNVSYDVSRAWSLFSGYTFMRSKIISDANPVTVGQDFAFSPRNKLMLGTSWSDPRLAAVNATLRYKDIQYSDVNHVFMARAYWTFDLGLRRDIREGLWARVDFENLFDKRYNVYDFRSVVVESPGRLITGSIGLSF